MSIVAFMVRVNKVQATTNYFKSTVDKTKWRQIIRILRDNEGIQDNCSDTSKRMNSNLITIIQIFQILMYVNFKIISLKWQ
jgi:ActR/RegA family two-component response regulator